MESETEDLDYTRFKAGIQMKKSLDLLEEMNNKMKITQQEYFFSKHKLNKLQENINKSIRNKQNQQERLRLLASYTQQQKKNMKKQYFINCNVRRLHRRTLQKALSEKFLQNHMNRQKYQQYLEKLTKIREELNQKSFSEKLFKKKTIQQFKKKKNEKIRNFQISYRFNIRRKKFKEIETYEKERDKNINLVLMKKNIIEQMRDKIQNIKNEQKLIRLNKK